METKRVTGKKRQRDLAFDVLLCSVTDVQRRLEKYGANTSVHVQF